MARIGRYELGRLLGEGGSGRVHEAIMHGPGELARPVALKLLRAEGDLWREARIGALLRHRNLVDVFEIGHVDGQWFCALELCPLSLRDALPLPPRAVVEVGLQVCDALAYAHGALGLVHLDLKPDNLLVSATGVVKVADLGIARAEGFAGDGRIRGTPGYMPPEQARGAAVDARTDIWALGATLCVLATGELPGHSEATFSFDEAPSGPTTSVPAWLEPAVAPCLEPDPDARWATMEDLAAALRALPVTGPGLADVLGIARAQPRAAREPLLGRTDEVEALVARLARPGIVALIGPAGVGKSRLAEEVASRWHGPYWRCDGSRTASAGGLADVVARVLGVRLPARDPLDATGRALASRGDALLIVDDLDPTADLAAAVARLHHLAPRARLLLTSRTGPLPVGADVHRVEPLDRDDAVALLVARARRRGADIASDPQLETLASRLDGLPLALELAAGRLGVLTVSELVERFDLSLLRSGEAGRHGTLEAVLDSVWDQLSPAERAALTQLATFVGGFTEELAEEVVVVDAPLATVLEGLRTRFVVTMGSTGRCHLPHSVAAHVRRQGIDVAAEQRHGLAMVRLARGNRAQPWKSLPRRLAERDNLLAACRRAAARGDTEIATATLGAVWGVLKHTGPFDEAAELCARVLDLPLSHGQRARAGSCAGEALARFGDLDEAERHQREALDHARAASDPRGEILVGTGLANLLRQRGQLAASRGVYEHLVALGRARAEDLLGPVLSGLGILEAIEGHIDRARALMTEALDRVRALGAPLEEGVLLGNLGNLCFEEGRYEEAVELFLRALTGCEVLEGEGVLSANLSGSLGLTYAALGRYDEALACHLRGVQILSALGDAHSLLFSRGNLGDVHRDLGQYDEAEAQYRLALEEARRMGQERLALAQDARLGSLALARGQLDEAQQRLTRALDGLRGAGDARTTLGAVMHLAETRLGQGDVDAAASLFDEAWATAEHIGDKASLGRLCGLGVGLALARGAPRQAEAKAREGIARLEPIGERVHRGALWVDLARLAMADSRLDEAATALDTALDLLPAGLKGDRSIALAALAELHLRRGDPSTAARLRAEASALAPPQNAEARACLDDLAVQLRRGLAGDRV